MVCKIFFLQKKLEQFVTFHPVRRLANKRELHPYTLKEDTQSKLSDERKDNLTKIIAQKDAQKAQQQANTKDANIGKIVQVCFFFFNFCFVIFI